MNSSDFQLGLSGGTPVHGWRAGPRASPRAVVQLIHGMSEHSARYRRLAEALAAAGYAVYAHDLPGHGPKCPPAHRGHLADRRGWRRALGSVRNVHRLAQQEHPKVPVFMLGHSMGSFLLQHYMADSGRRLAGAVLSATTGDFGKLRTVGIGLVRAEALVFGMRRPSAVGEALSFRSFNKAFKPARTPFDWLSGDPDEVDRYVADPHCGFRCTTGLWLDMLLAAGRLAQPARLRRIPAELPVLMIAGELDPVTRGAYGPNVLANLYRNSGVRDVSVSIYPRARHEVFNDVCREQATADLIEWLGNQSASKRS